MEKLKKYNVLKKLSLFQQLIALLLVAALLIVVVMMPIVDFNLKSIIDNQMYESLKSEQNMLINNTSFVPKIENKSTIHIIYDSSTNRAVSTDIVIDEIVKYYSNIFIEPLEVLKNQPQKSFIEGKSNQLNDTYYYLITRISSTHYLISLRDSAYSNDLITSIRNQIIYIQYAFFLMIAGILIIWVISLIKPLHKIKEYIDTIKNRKDMYLYIDREDEIGVVSSALVEMKMELKKQEKIKEEMIHNMSHDLKTPIALIKTYGQSVKDDIYPYGDKDSSMDIIIENAERLDHKVKSFLYLNRLDYLNNENKVLDPIELKPLIVKIVEQFQSLNTHIDFVEEVDDVCFVGEEEHWRVAIENIVENALRYSKNTIKIILKDNYLEIYNDGEAIDEEEITCMFKPYVKGIKGQFGLGLSIVYKITSMYGFDVSAHNKDNGVSFIIKKHLS